MAKQGGILGLRGTVGGLVFSANGTVRQKPASRPVTSTRTLENNAEFGAAAAASKIVRDALRTVSQTMQGRNLTGRMTQAMRQIIGLDTVNDRGLRQVLKANIGALEGFDFSDRSLTSVFYAPYTVAYGAGADEDNVLVTIPSLVPNNDLNVPQGATHFQIVAAGAQVDFSTGAAKLSTQTLEAPTAIGAVDVTPGATTLEFATALAAGSVTIVAVGVVYFQEVNGSFYPLGDGSALSIVYAV